MKGCPVRKADPEIALLTHCLRQYVSGDRTSEIAESLNHPVDWNRMTRLVSYHRVGPVIYVALQEAQLPEYFIKKLKEQYQAGALLSQIKTVHLTNLVKTFETRQVPVIPWRGPLFSSLYYRDSYDRHFGDLDFICKKTDLNQLKEILHMEGFQMAEPEREVAGLLEEEHAVAFVKEENGIHLELDVHWTFSEKRWHIPYPDDAIWSCLRTTTLNDTPIRHLSAEDLLLSLCIHHGLRSGWQKMKYLIDVALLIKGERTLEWEELLEKSRKLGIYRLVVSGVAAAHYRLGAGVPPFILAKAEKDFRIRWLTNAILESFEAKDNTPVWIQLVSAPHPEHILPYHIRQRLGAIFLPNKNDYEANPLPSCLYFLYFIIRPVRLLKKYGTSYGFRDFFRKM